jgi:hypothetical protein
MTYIIIGYDVINGSKQQHKVKNKRCNSLAEINLFEKQVQHGYKQIGQKVQVYAIYKYKPLQQRKCLSK